ncbi:uncharacterized protein FYW49_011461 isoform 23-T23 [Xenentodon cancila]
MNLWRKLNLTESLQDQLNIDVEVRLRSTETHLEHLETLTAALEVKLGVKEEQLEDLRTQNSDQTSTLMNLWRKLNLSESLQDKLNTADVEFKLRSTETHLEQLENFTAALEVKLGVKEEQLEDLRTQNSDQTSTLMNLWRKLNLSESLQDKLNTADVEFKLRSTETHLEQLENFTAALEVKLGVKEEQLEDLRTQNSDQTSTLMNLWRKLNLSESLQDKLNTADVEFKLRSTETHLEQLENFTAALEVKLGVKEEQLEDLRTQNSDQTSTLMNLWRKLNLSESLQDKLNTDVEVRLRSTETHLEHLETLTAALEVKLGVKEEQLEDLRTQNSDQTSTLMNLWRKLNLSESLQDKLNTADVEFKLRSTETHLEQLENFTAALEVKLGVKEEQLEDLRTQNSGCEARLSAVAVGLNRTEEQLDDLRTQSSGSSALLVSLSDRLTAAQRDTEELQVRLKTSEATVNQLKSKNGDELKVGFSAGLTNSGSIGPFDEETTLIFSKAITNIGQGYNQSAGVFTAPVRGVYFFSFTAADYVKGYMGVNLYRNNQPIIFSLDLNDHGGYASASSTVALQLEEGDQVRLSLPASYRLYDDSRNFSVFSGFLLFQL